jgi:hypothetical protein
MPAICPVHLALLDLARITTHEAPLSKMKAVKAVKMTIPYIKICIR